MDGGMQVLAAVSLARTFTFVKSPPWLQRRFIGKKSLDEFLFEDLPRNGRLLSIWGPRSRLQPPCADETEALAACEQMEQPLQALL